MRIFVTGATGFVGSAVVRELLDAGHAVLGLCRSEVGARRLAEWGAEVHRGDLDDLDSLSAGAEQADGVIHTAFNHDFTRYVESCAADSHIIRALGEPLLGSNRPLLVTAGIGVLPDVHLITERDKSDYGPTAHPRTASEAATDALTERGVRAAVVRLPPSVHGEGDRAFVPMLIDIARRKGLSAYIGNGLNRWSAVHRADAARLFRLALEECEAGARYHGVGERGVVFKVIAEAIGHGLGLPVESVDEEQGEAHFGWFARFAALNVPASNDWTWQKLGWQATEPTLLEDMVQAGYFRS